MICALGWEIWYTYGLVGGLPVDARRAPALAVLLVVFVGQNVYVEYVIHDQVKHGLPLSWAPLIPTGPWFNFVLFEINDRAITFQTQLPWVLMVPVFSWLTIWCYRRYGHEKSM